MQHLPVHPTARHPRTGAPLRALYVRPDGRVFWPILGASPDDGDKGGAGGTGDAGTGGAGGTGSTGDSGDKGGAGDGDKGKGGAGGDAGAGGDQGGDLGFPKDTPVAEMTDKQQAAYYKHQSRRHEGRATEWQRIAGDKTPEQVKADLEAAEKLRKEQMTDAERQVAEAKEQATKTTAQTVGEANAQVALEIALGHDPEKNDRSAVLNAVDLRRLITDDGKVDADKVRALAAEFAHTDKGSGGGRPDFGAGRRGGGPGKTGVAAGRELYEQSRKKTTSTT